MNYDPLITHTYYYVSISLFSSTYSSLFFPLITHSISLHQLLRLYISIASTHSTPPLLPVFLRNSPHLSRTAEMLSAAELINFAWCETEDGFPGRLGGFSSLEPF